MGSSAALTTKLESFLGRSWLIVQFPRQACTLIQNWSASIPTVAAGIFKPFMCSWWSCFIQFTWHVCELGAAKRQQHLKWYLTSQPTRPHWVWDCRVQLVKKGLPYCCHSDDCPPHAIKNASPKTSWKLLRIWPVILVNVKHKVISILHKKSRAIFFSRYHFTMSFL